MYRTVQNHSAVLSTKLDGFWRLPDMKISNLHCEMSRWYREEAVQRGKIDSLIEIGKCFGMERSVEKKLR